MRTSIISPATLALLLALASLPASAADASDNAATVSGGADSDTGLRWWQVDGPALSLRLMQLLPDQTRAFFLGRGFPSEAADAFARRCVFQAIANNHAAANGPAIGSELSRWRVHADSTAARPPLLERDWQPRWAEMGVPQSARLAFRWALFPTEQRFAPGDGNWGMVAFGLSPGAHFDLAVVWTEDGMERRARVEGLRCAEDIDQ